MTELEKAFELKLSLDSVRPIDKEREAIILQKFRLDWNYNSNHMEGNSLTYGETKALILFGITASAKPLKDHFEMVGHDEAIKWVMDVVSGDYPLSENFIRELHTLILKEPYEMPAITADGQPTVKRVEIGRYKTSPNHVLTNTGEIFRFASPEETEAGDLNPIILASEFHYKFIRFHPFDDGNGRVARILMNFILLKNGYPPVVIKAKDKENYYGVLRQADIGTIEPFIEYISTNLVRSLEIMIAGANGENIEEADDLDKEIALLQSRLTSLQNSGKVISKDSILNFYNNSFKSLVTAFFGECSKFDVFYKQHQLFLNVSGHTATGDLDVLDALEEFVNGDLKEMLAQYQFSESKEMAININSYTPFLVIKFSSHTIDISSGSLISQAHHAPIKLTKYYDDEISPEEIITLIKPLSDFHKKLIADKLAEMENRKE
jgi:Fic family protein